MALSNLPTKSSVLPADRRGGAIEDVDGRCLAEYCARYRAQLVAFLRAKFGAGPPEPEDIAQQAFANLTALGARASIGNPRAFLYKAARNIAINDYRRQRVGRGFLEHQSAPELLQHVAHDVDTEAVVLGKQELRLVEHAIMGMPEQRRQILLLNRLDGHSYAEIARRLGLSESVVRKHTARAVRDCAAALFHSRCVPPADGGHE